MTRLITKGFNKLTQKIDEDRLRYLNSHIQFSMLTILQGCSLVGLGSQRANETHSNA